MRAAAAIIALGLAPFVSAHCKITGATGDQGGSAAALGIKAGSGNTQADTTILKQKTGFGTTPGGGKINVAKDLPAAMAAGGKGQLPQVSAGGSVNMVLHQVNGDGAGPMTCAISMDATGQNWQPLQVTKNVPGTKGRSKANNQDFQLSVQMPQTGECTGQAAGQSNLCMVKCQNPVGPFGGVVPVQMAGAGNATEGEANNAGTAGNAGSAGKQTGTQKGTQKGTQNAGQNANNAGNAAGDAVGNAAGNNAGNANKATKQANGQNGQSKKQQQQQQKANANNKRVVDDDLDCDMSHEVADGWTPEKRSATFAGRAAGVREALRRMVDANLSH